MSSDWTLPPPPHEHMEGQQHAEPSAPPPGYQSELPLSSLVQPLPQPSAPPMAYAAEAPPEIPALAPLNLVPGGAPGGAPPKYVAPMPAFLVPKPGQDSIRIHHGVYPEMLLIMYCPIYLGLGCALTRSTTLTFYEATEELRVTSYPGHLFCCKRHRVIDYRDIAAVVAKRAVGKHGVLSDTHFSLELHLRNRERVQIADVQRKDTLKPFLLGYHRLLFGREDPERYRFPVWEDLLDN